MAYTFMRLYSRENGISNFFLPYFLVVSDWWPAVGAESTGPSHSSQIIYVLIIFAIAK